jgi:excisionase family DNA binding protein
MAAKRDEIMTIDELAEYLKISKSTLYKLAVENKLPGTKIGKRWRFHKEAIDEWVKQGPSQSKNQRTER